MNLCVMYQLLTCVDAVWGGVKNNTVQMYTVIINYYYTVLVDCLFGVHHTSHISLSRYLSLSLTHTHSTTNALNFYVHVYMY
jgi:hypothetical protein